MINKKKIFPVSLPAGFPNSTVVEYTMHPNVYGRYSDPYLIKSNKTNPHELVLTKDGNLIHDPVDETVVIQVKGESVSTNCYFVITYAFGHEFITDITAVLPLILPNTLPIP